MGQLTSFAGRRRVKETRSMAFKGEQKGRGQRNQRGSVMVMTAIAMLALFLILGLAIDASRIFMARAELQNAADAAALSAARELNSGTDGIEDAATAAVS